MRIHFTRADLTRTHLADGPDPMWELVSSLQLLQNGYDQRVFQRWRKQVAADLRRSELSGPVRTRLLPVAPDAFYFPDLLTPPEAALGVDEAIDTILHTPRRRLGAEIGRLAGPPGTGSWLADLATGRAEAMARLGDLIRAYHRCAVLPYWSRLQLWVDSDLAMRRQLVRGGGVGRLLDSFRPMMRWRYPVLEVPEHPSDRDVHLDGRGLLLVPSYFCCRHPVTIFDPALPQVVVYPVERAADWLDHGPDRTARPALERLIGHTRAVVLLATQGGCTTSELARRLGVSEATVSYHIGILRDAGLVTSRRRANTVLHILSPLGGALMRQRI
jgi:DNA-binding transcriptional ArsR family regulator